MATTQEERTVTLSPAEVAARLGVKVSTLANWRWAGQGPRYVKVGRLVRYAVADLAEWVSGQTRRSTSDQGADE